MASIISGALMPLSVRIEIWFAMSALLFVWGELDFCIQLRMEASESPMTEASPDMDVCCSLTTKSMNAPKSS